MLSKLKNRTVQTLLLITIYAIFAPSLSTHTHQSLYTLSILIKDILVWIMPITVCVFIASTIDSFERKAPLFILILVLFEGCSNFLSVWYAYGAGSIVSNEFGGFEIVDLKDNFKALWRIPLQKPIWWGADKGSIAGLIIGCISALLGSRNIKTILTGSKNIIEAILTKGFARLIPIFVLGFIAQIYKTGLLNHMIVHYSMLILYLLFFILMYLLLIFAVGNGFRPSGMIRDIKNLLPAGGVALTSGCSLSTMPWTIKGTSMNLKDPELAKAIIPATTNIQQIGDCITNTFLCFLIYKHFFGYTPDVLTWGIFSLVFVAARFATAAVIGGAIFIMLPIYQNYLSFSDEMLAIILALNVILDPIVTSSNVVANGGLAKIFENVWTIVCPKKG